MGSFIKKLQWLLISRRNELVHSTTQLGISQNHLFFTFRSLSSLSNSKKLALNVGDKKDRSFMMSYLINECGFSPESAEYVSKNVYFENPKKPDAVMRLLRSYGFTNEHISKLGMTKPKFILAKSEKTLLPKLEFLLSIGVPRSNLGGIVSSDPDLLSRSLEQHLVPSYNILKRILCCDNEVAKAFMTKRVSRINLRNLDQNLATNVSVLRKLGMPQSIIFYMVIYRVSLACVESDKFGQAVNKVIEIGFDPWKYTFVEALRVIAQMSQTTWERKMEVFRKWGLTDDEIWSAFKKCPRCMTYSEKKIMGIMDFLVNKMGWEPAVVAKFSHVFGPSLEKTIVPRCSVARVLMSKGLINSGFSLRSMLHLPEQRFIDLFVTKYRHDIPQLLSIYKGKTSILELGFRFEDKKEAANRT